MIDASIVLDEYIRSGASKRSSGTHRRVATNVTTLWRGPSQLVQNDSFAIQIPIREGCFREMIREDLITEELSGRLQPTPASLPGKPTLAEVLEQRNHQAVVEAVRKMKAIHKGEAFSSLRSYSSQQRDTDISQQLHQH